MADRLRRWSTALGVCVAAATTSSPALADERGYELVTPAGGGAEVRIGGGYAVPDGNVVCFASEDSIAGSDPNGIVFGDDGFCARRDVDGAWTTSWVTGPHGRAGRHGSRVFQASDDGRRVLYTSDNLLGDDYAFSMQGYLWSGGGTTWLSPALYPNSGETASPFSTPDRVPQAASADLGSVLFQTSIRLVAADANEDPDVYEWSEGDLRLVSRDAGGSAVGGRLGRSNDDSRFALAGALSRDGTIVTFQSSAALTPGAVAGVSNAYQRLGDTVRLVSPRRGPDGTTPADIAIAGVADDGSIVYLATTEQLTEEVKEPGTALYRYRVAADELELVATAPGGVRSLAVSGDGSTVFFADAANTTLQVVRDGASQPVGAIDPGDAFTEGMAANTDANLRGLRVTRDGLTAVFVTSAAADGIGAGGIPQVFRWTASEGTRRISAASDDSAPRSPATIGNLTSSFAPPRNEADYIHVWPVRGRVISGDGTSVFFETADRLLPSDTNRAIDVYEWRQDGLRLVSPGDENQDAFYLDSSDDGGAVFFTSRQRVLPGFDVNSARDVYVARVGVTTRDRGESRCEGDPCQGPPRQQQPPVIPGSSVFVGAGDTDEPEPPAERRLGIVGFGVGHARQLARRGRAVVQVRTPGAGTVTANANARVKGRTLRVASGRRSAAGAGVVRVTLRLTPRARKLLRQGRRLRITLTVEHVDAVVRTGKAVTLRG